MILVTAFEPFGGEKSNASYEAVRLLPEELCGFEVRKELLPVVFGKAGERVISLVEELSPYLVLCTGVAGGRKAVTPEKIAVVKSFPAIFANQNHSFAKTDDSHKAFFGIIRDVQIKEEGIWIYFYKMRKVTQQVFNEHAAEFGIEGTEFKNELDCTHWSIKRVNVLETLEKAGHKITLI